MHDVKTRQQVADEYGVHRSTFRRWLKRAKIATPNGLIYPTTLQQIYRHFGNPHTQ
jgi:DNA invertase Pin-like site-specific DNA recombinase